MKDILSSLSVEQWVMVLQGAAFVVLAVYQYLTGKKADVNAETIKGWAEYVEKWVEEEEQVKAMSTGQPLILPNGMKPSEPPHYSAVLKRTSDGNLYWLVTEDLGDRVKETAVATGEEAMKLIEAFREAQKAEEEAADKWPDPAAEAHNEALKAAMEAQTVKPLIVPKTIEAKADLTASSGLKATPSFHQDSDEEAA